MSSRRSRHKSSTLDILKPMTVASVTATVATPIPVPKKESRQEKSVIPVEPEQISAEWLTHVVNQHRTTKNLGFGGIFTQFFTSLGRKENRAFISLIVFTVLGVCI